MHGQVHKRDGAEPLVLKRTRRKAERVRHDNRASAEVQVPNQDKAWYEFWKDDYVSETRTRYEVKMEYVGKEVSVDQFIQE